MSKKEIKIYPQKARVEGNLMTKFGVPGQPYHWDSHHVKIIYQGRPTVRSIQLHQFQMTSEGDPCKIVLEKGAVKNIRNNKDVVYITATVLTNTKGQTSEPIVEQEVRVSEGSTLLDQQVTDKNGMITYAFTSSKGGKHTLKFFTTKQNGYNPASATTTINVLYGTTLSLTPREYSTEHNSIVPLVFTLKDENNKPVSNKHITISESGRILDSSHYVTNSKGQITYKYTEEDDNGAMTTMTPSIPTFYQHTEGVITGKVVYKSHKMTTSQPVTAGEVYLYNDYDPHYLDRTTIQSGGTFSLKCTFKDRVKHKIHLVYRGTLEMILDADGKSTGVMHNKDFEPTMVSKTVQAIPAPLIVMNVSPTTRWLGDISKVVISVRDSEKPQYNWKGTQIRVYERLITKKSGTNIGYNYGKWTVVNGKTYSLDNKGNCTFNWTHNIQAGTYQLKAVFLGNKVYGHSETKEDDYPEIVFKEKPVYITITAPKTIETGLSYNMTANLKTSNNVPLSNVNVAFWLDSEVSKGYIGTGVTDAKGNVAVAYKPHITGNHVLIVKYTKGNSKYSTTTRTQSLLITKISRSITFKSPGSIVYLNTKFNIIGIVTSRNKPLSGVTVHLNDGKLDVDVKTNKNGVFTSSYTQTNSNLQQQHILNATILEDSTYTKTVQNKVYNVTNKPIPSIVFNPINTVLGKEYTITASVPSDATGSFNIILKRKDATSVTIAKSLKQKNGKITFTTSWKGYVKGAYTYTIHYNGDGNYTSYTESYKALNLYGSLEINVDQISNKKVSTTYNSLLPFTGTVTGALGEKWSGTLYLYVSGGTGTSTAPALTIPVTDGKFKGSSSVLDTGLSKLNLHPGTFDAMFKGIPNKGVATERKFQLILTQGSISSLVVNNVNMMKGGKVQLKVNVPEKSNGTITFYKTNSTGTHQAVIGQVNTKNIKTVNSSDKSKTASITTNSFKTSGVGTYYYTAKLEKDSYNNNIESNTAKINVRTNGTIMATDSFREFTSTPIKITVRVNDSLNQGFNGIIKVTNHRKSETENVVIKNGVGTYTLTGSNREYHRHDNMTHLTFSYSDDISSNFNASKDVYTYEIPRGMRSIFINSNSGFNGSSSDNTQIKTFNSMGIVDLFVYTSVGSTKQGLLENVIKALKNTKLEASFRVHAVVNVLHDSSGWYTYSDTHRVKTSRIKDVNNSIDSLLKNYDIQGICLDSIRLANKNTSSTNETDVTSVLTSITNHIKSISSKKRTIIISACVVADTDNAKGTYGQNYETFSKNCDFVIPMLYIYDYTDTTKKAIPSIRTNWLQIKYDIIKKLMKDDNLIPAITTYCGEYEVDGKYGIRRNLTKEEYISQLRALLIKGIRGYALFRAGLLTSGLPSYKNLVDVKNTSTNVNTNILLAGDNGKTTNKISQYTALNKGIALWLRDAYGGYVQGGTVGLKIDSKTLTLKNKTTTLAYDGSSIFYVPVDIRQFSLGTHKLEVIYQTSSTSKLNSIRKSFTVTITK